jgi:tRNA-uridine 2-sulfurtransferase
MRGRVVLAMSGGVDSSVAAVLLKRQGYDVVGLFMRTGVEHPAHDDVPDRKKGCCSAVDAGDARRVADRLDLPFYALDFEQDFGRIIDYFADEYLAGRTPNPCVVCNTWLKFGKLWSFGKQLDADYIATGHYARIVAGENGPELHKAADPDKDQSYVLSGIKRAVLPHLLFPLGGYRKDEVRALARETGLAVADKPDSVEICFVPDHDHAALVRRRRPGRDTAGVIRDTAGTVVGTHDGYERFTVGQRKGLGVAAGSRRYVLEIVPATHEVIVGEPEGLRAGGLVAARVNWLTDVPGGPLDCQVKIRYRHTPADATLIATADGGAAVTFAEPQTAVTPGQAVVFYTGDRVLGGGWIENAV